MYMYIDLRNGFILYPPEVAFISQATDVILPHFFGSGVFEKEMKQNDVRSLQNLQILTLVI